mmetsp:Transcript_6318/g.7241  ORF Transcript_6318/g.7241 Transcript_6318/m.7241 type:complete len:458 (+) Transcript_6318:216-1589(+)
MNCQKQKENASSSDSVCSEDSLPSVGSQSKPLSFSDAEKFLPIAEDCFQDRRKANKAQEKKSNAKAKAVIVSESGAKSLKRKRPSSYSSVKEYANSQKTTPSRIKKKAIGEPFTTVTNKTKCTIPANDSIALPKLGDLSFQHEGRWHDSYVRTRHKNIRCFPFCSPQHRERSFCGQSLVATIKFSNAKMAKWIHARGMFRKKSEDLYFKHGNRENEPTLPAPKNEIIEGNLIRQDAGSNTLTFEFQPPRKWRYKCEQNKYTTAEKHVFSVYFFEKRSGDSFHCFGYGDSPSFRISSAWNQSLQTVSRPLITVESEKVEKRNGKAAVTSQNHLHKSLTDKIPGTPSTFSNGGNGKTAVMGFQPHHQTSFMGGFLELPYEDAVLQYHRSKMMTQFKVSQPLYPMVDIRAPAPSFQGQSYAFDLYGQTNRVINPQYTFPCTAKLNGAQPPSMPQLRQPKQ